MSFHSKMVYVSEDELETLPISTLISYRVRNLRIEQSLTQEQLAFDSGVDRSYIGQIERCEKNVTVVTLQKIAKSLGLTIVDFLNFESLIDKNKEV